MTTFLIGPSHVDNCFIGPYLEMFTNTTFDCNPGRPNWSKTVLELVSKDYHNYDQIIWMVSDYRFNNEDIHDIVSSDDSLFLDKIGRGDNITKSLISPQNDRIVCERSLKCIDYIIKNYPKVKLLFWCLYTRSKIYTSSLPHEFHYDEIKKRYKDNILDIDEFISPEEFKTCILDPGGHPNVNGYNLLKNIINSGL